MRVAWRWREAAVPDGVQATDLQNFTSMKWWSWAAD
jgi:hypothetical protein